ncbi:RNA polymerase factor sigma-54 [Paralcaligenes sp. KSB-10]|uniref:RNA polymerase factor sigma-54 n=1 Tax=Paralcaligenes sp. KSB-10 TaxID=2901142 RepID=UPI0021058F4E|nr:hypothetical protein [Paralcaligenes sp. KSB-10]
MRPFTRRTPLPCSPAITKPALSKEPLSDVVLARKLAREGVVVARRTVSKYRAQIKCPTAELRKSISVHKDCD